MTKLLSITNLKKYFPVAKSSLFQKEQYYVRANEDISLDIYEGETFGLVGESGCGKSTLGRVILQLYSQTAGNTIYYGRSLASVAPSYVTEILRHPEKYAAAYREAEKKAAEASAHCDSLGENASFLELQSRNLAIAEARSARDRAAKLLGGFLVRDTKEGAAALLARYELGVEQASLEAELAEIEQAESESDNRSGKAEALREKLAALESPKAEADARLTGLRGKYTDDAEFAAFEALLDDGIDLSQLTIPEMRAIRRDLQIIFQDPYSSLNPRMTVGQIIEEGLVTHNFFRRGSPKMKEYIIKVMEDCGLQDYMFNRYPHQFSGGQRQRICIARSLAVKPKFVVCDECVSALDVSIQSQIINLLQELKEKEKLTYLFISHNLSVVRYISDRIGVMYLGNLVEVAETDVIFRDPRHPYTVALLSSIPTTDLEDAHRERIILQGSIPSPIKPPSGCKFHTRCFMACEKCKRVPPPFTEVEPGHFVACHFPEKKLDENGSFLFEPPKA